MQGKSEKWIGNARRSNCSKGPSKTVLQKLCLLSSLSTDADVNEVSIGWLACGELLSRWSPSTVLLGQENSSDFPMVDLIDKWFRCRLFVWLLSLFLFFLFFFFGCCWMFVGLQWFSFCSTDFIVWFLLLEYCLIRGVGPLDPQRLSSLIYSLIPWPVWIRTLCLT